MTYPPDILKKYQEYQQLVADQNYSNVHFNASTGGLMAVHCEHQFDPTIGRFGIPRGDYEHITTEILYKNGYCVILNSERNKDWIKTPDGLLNGILFEIKGIEGAGKRNIEYKIREAGKKNAAIVVLYFHNNDIFSLPNIIRDYASYLRNSPDKLVNQVYYIVNGELHKIS